MAWTLIVQAGGDDEHAQLAMEKPCQLYWFPLYAFARRTGQSREDGEESKQFFWKMIDGAFLEKEREVEEEVRYLMAALG